MPPYLIVLLLAGPVQAEQPSVVTQQQTAIDSKSERIRIHNPWGDIRLRDNGDQSRTVILQTLQGQGLSLKHQQVEGRLELVVQAVDPALLPGKRKLPRMDLAIRLPRHRRVEARTLHGDIEVRGVHNPLQLTTRTGDVIINKVHGPIQASSETGVVRATLLPAANGREQTFSSSKLVELWLPDDLPYRVELSTHGPIESPLNLQGDNPTYHLNPGRTDLPLLKLLSPRGKLVLKTYPSNEGLSSTNVKNRPIKP